MLLNKFRFLTIVLMTITSGMLCAQTYDSVKDFVNDKNIDADTEVTLKNLTIIDIDPYVKWNYLIVDKNGTPIKYNSTINTFSRGDFFSEIKGQRSPKSENPFYFFVGNNDNIPTPTSQNQIDRTFANPQILTDRVADDNDNLTYVRAEGTVNNVRFDINGTLTNTANNVRAFLLNLSSGGKCIVYHDNLNSIKDIVTNSQYTVYGMVDNTLLPDRIDEFEDYTVIRLFSYWKTEDTSKHSWKIGVFPGISDEGKCYLSDSSTGVDGDNIVWENVGDGAAITLNAVPENGYEFEGWTLNGQVISQDNTFTFAAISDGIYKAVFNRDSSSDDSYELIVSLSNGGG